MKMKTEDVIKIFNQHRLIEEVILEKSKNLSENWGDFVLNVYYNNKIEGAHLDWKLKDSLLSFSETDSLDIVNKKGKILKRFSYFYKLQNDGEIIPDDIMGILGDILQNLVTKELSRKFFVDFTNSFDWNDGDFGNKGSCWWGGYSDSLPTFEENGGWCIRFYDESKNGIGRTWLYPDPEENVILGFNSYGVERPKVSKIIKKIFLEHGIELHYATCNIENRYSSNIPYINGGTGFVLYDDGDSPKPDYDLNMYVVRDENHANCENCGYRINTDNEFYINVGDYIYCEDCTHKLFSFCDKCQEYCRTDDVNRVSDRHSRYDYLCEYCADSIGMMLCYDCGEWTDCGIITEDTANAFCENCDRTFFCEECGNYFENHSECPDCEPDCEEEETEPDTNLKDKYPGLVAQSQVLKFLGTEKEVYTYRYENIPGLLVCKNEKKWMVYHSNTQLATMTNISTFEYAIAAMEKFGELANWALYLTVEQVLEDKLLCEKARAVQSYIRRNME